MTKEADIALIGLAVMGQNLILNMDENGFKVVAYNRSVEKTRDFLAGPAKDTNIIGAESLEELVQSLSKPRKIMMMVRAGDAVDATIESLLPLLDKGDLIIDGGNSNFDDSQRRALALEQQGFMFIGTGVSGGEEGARNGPSIMPGGNPKAWPLVKDLFQKISAKTDSGAACCEWVGENGAGHFVKMVHNGIEYGDMQLICEAYHFMKKGLGLGNTQMQQIFSQWNQVDIIVDHAGQKGTGKWTGINALELGVPLTLIGEAVFSRYLSAIRHERIKASNVLSGPDTEVIDPALTDKDTAEWINWLGDALLASKIISYAQGYMLMRSAASEYNWNLQYGSIAQMWRGGCIIRSVFLDDIKNAYDKNPELENLLLDDYFAEAIDSTHTGWRKIIGKAVEQGIPVPAMSSALAFYDGYRTARLPANLLQAQRDYFGAHTYERMDKPAGERFHTNWTGEGGDVSSSSYDA